MNIISDKEQARRSKISEARKRRKEKLGYINSPDTRQKQGDAKRGIGLSDEHRAKISAAKKGKRPKNWEDAIRKAHDGHHPKDADNPNWKGDQVGYFALHAWITRTLGTPHRCENCGKTDAKRYEWSNKSGEYHRDISDWERLCASCHRKQGYERGEYAPWNKGQKIQTNTGRTHFKKGQPSGRKYLEPRKCELCGNEFQPRLAIRKYCSRKCYWQSMNKHIEIKET